ncbi:unnamed protein product [Didymodactylos carnosus]|uniref:Cell wall hydrolase SleB domain-containing protein n=1 Tax=Didymodactylos carnosus TaxID=1234261 RepID=A0A814J9I1_9BILA|nr:unnamed protein product [Didymodactylos carnosus]CAF1034447.1 unnamed protein product [Didymodactylos carnosus]CAF3620890.1 unnamed protein product [Didymodactylos carnosus]CAF3805088.1 unnamed protein product [Didymodactylos carnosus]
MGNTIKEVCLKPQQYSCWNTDDVNYQKIKDLDVNDNEYKKILRIVQNVVDGKHQDNTNGSTHYHANYIHPRWATTPTVTIGQHLFYNNVK